MIEASGLIRSFGKLRAVDSLDFTIGRGEIFGIVGPDGAGKSTLLRMMAAILKPNAGSITVNGESLFENIYGIKERLAYMPQRFGLYEDLTVEENIFFFGRLFNVSRQDIRRSLPRLYGFSRLGPFKERLAGKLSGGMKQKLGLACCLVHRPDIILLDEPTNGVDPVSRREFWEILYDLLGEGVTIVVSTAYLDEAERCNRLALMHQGKFIRLGNPASIKKGMGKRMVQVVSEESRKAEAILKKNRDFHTVIRTGHSLKVFSDDVKKTMAQLRRLLAGKKIPVRSIGEISPGLEDCFMEIISEEGT